MTVRSATTEDSLQKEGEMGISPTAFSEKKSKAFLRLTKHKSRKKKGQFFTPIEIAKHMAEPVTSIDKEVIRVLDPGAGTGILSCAIFEQIASRDGIKSIEVDAYEDDPILISFLHESFEHAQRWLAQKGINLIYNIHEEDFILAAGEVLEYETFSPYDIATGNPPYFKISKDDPRAKVAEEFVHGQPNVYSLFMGMSAKLLDDTGLMVFITPRSYTAGPYFKAFRKSFFKDMSPEKIHIFESRKDAFRKESVLQENIILQAKKHGTQEKIEISTSKGINDLQTSKTYSVDLDRALFKRNGDIILRLPIDDYESEILNTVDSWEGNLHRYGMEISTGPVVPFRAESYTSCGYERKGNFVPLLWMHDIHPMKVRWPSKSKKGKEKPHLISDNKQTRKRKLLVNDENLVLLRRFSAKEQKRRLIAAPLHKGQLKSGAIGLENHVNYIYRPDGVLDEVETIGLAGVLNSSLLDRYFRISNGNTQVSATELRVMPLPPISTIRKLGERIKEKSSVPTLNEIDSLLFETMDIQSECV